MADCIIARFEEDLKWIENFNFNFHIYNKGKAGINPLPNVGREIQSFIYHIVRHYDGLADINIFLQGNPFSHCQFDLPRILSDIYTVMEGRNYLDLGSKKLLEHKDGEVLSDGIRCKRPLPFCRYFEEIMREPCPNYFDFVVGANCAIRKEAIQRRPIEFYENILAIFDRDGDFPAWNIERFWKLIFTT